MKCLFIGGEYDGELLEVDIRVHSYRLYSKKNACIEIEYKVRSYIDMNGTLHFVYVHDVADNELLARIKQLNKNQ